MLGVATPSDLIKDKRRTPFNIGRAIELKELQLYETEPLARGLAGVGNPQKLMEAILHWTGGQPFLTQKICSLIVKSQVITSTSSETSWVADLVRSKIINNLEKQDEPKHLRTIRDRILFLEETSGQLLRLYQKILQPGEIIADGSQEVIQLLLLGLIVKQEKTIKVYNRIYEEVFNKAWVDRQLQQFAVNKQLQQFALKRILILSANPKNSTRLRLDEEVREIETAIERAQQRDQFEVKSRLALTHRELRRAIFEENPQIVHFCGHGMGEQGLVLEDDNTREVKFVSTHALAELFKLFADKVECVLLNASYSEVQAKAIAQHIDYVIGMKQSIDDRTAIEFAAGFYDALGAGRDYEFAYNFGRNSISLAGINQADIPILKKQARVRLWIHGWVKQMYDNSPTVELDWTEYFSLESASEPRRLANQETWDNILLPSLEQVREKVSQGHTELTVDIRGRLPLSAAVVIGHVFQDTMGYTLQVEQRTTGQNNLWHSNVIPSDAKFKIITEDGEVGEHILVALGITGDASRDLAQLWENSPIPFSAAIYAEPEAGTGERAISSNEDAIALTIHAKEIIRQARQKYRATSTHLVLYAPISFCFFLGQRLRVIGDVICYERVAGNYQP